MQRLIGLVIFCLAAVRHKAMSEFTCTESDLHTVMIHLRQLQTDYKQMNDMYEMDFATYEQQRSALSQKCGNDILAIQNLQNISDTDVGYLRERINELQERQNKSDTETVALHERIEELEGRVKHTETQILQQQSQISKLQDLLNASDTKLESQKNYIYDLKEMLNMSKAEMDKHLNELQNQLSIVEQETASRRPLLDQLDKAFNSTVEGSENLVRSVLQLNNTLQDAKELVEDVRSLFDSGQNAPRVRLVGGTNMTGRVEVSVDGYNWGTICSNGFDNNDAKVVCLAIGVWSRYGSRIAQNYSRTDGVGQAFLTNLACLGTETSLSYCQHDGWGLYDCLQYAGVNCQ